MNQGPLHGIRILDLSRILAGPTCTQLLGDFGADVIKVEKPGAGDDTRQWGPPFVTPADGGKPTESAYYLSVNRNKRSVALDIATEEGQALIRRLIAVSDVVIENFKPGGLDKYGLSYSQIAAAFPSVVYCSISGFGQTGPNAHLPGYDLMAQAFGGLMSITGEAAGEPMKVGVAITDICTGLYSASAILAALRHRDATGEGQQIDLSLADVQMACLANQGTNYLVSGVSPVRRGNAHPNIVPYQVFTASDGHLIVAVGNDEQFRRFCAILGIEALGDDPRFAGNSARVENRAELVPLLAERIAGFTRDALLARMAERKIPGGPINTVGEALESDQARARGMRIDMPHPDAAKGTVPLIGNPVKFSKSPVTYRYAPPKCGADTDAVLEELLGKAGG
ncbi:MAG: CoA transferase [Nitratireductor sp.]|nr:CoA transferase [Nitratireductor sp.]